MNMQTITDLLVAVVLPALWTAGGPVVTAAITAWVNAIPKAYVPRPVQVIISGLFTAVLAGMTGGLEGLGMSTSAGLGLAVGLGTQTFAALQPRTLLTSSPGSK